MIWSREKTIELDVCGESLRVTFGVPLPEEWEEAIHLLGGDHPKWTALCRLFVRKVDGLGFESADILYSTPGTSSILVAIGTEIAKSATLDVTLKNASGSSMS